MAENKAQTQVNVSENQLAQMAQQEEYELANKKLLIERVASMLRETVTTKEALNEIKNTKGKVGFAIGATVIIDAKVESTKMCRRAFAEDAYKEETIDETIEWLAKKEEPLKKQLEELRKGVLASSTRLSDILGIMKQIESEKRKQAQNARRSPPTISK